MKSRFQRFLYRMYRRYARFSGFWKKRLTTAGWLLVALTVISAAVGLNTNEASAYQLFTFLVALFAVAMLHSLFFRAKLGVQRRLPRFATAEAPLSYEVRVRNRTGRGLSALRLREALADAIPTQDHFLGEAEPEEGERNRFDRTLLFYRWMWLVRKCTLADTMETPPFAMAPRGETSVSMQIVPKRRGMIRLREMVVGRADLFGLFKGLRRVEAGQHDTVTILPKRYPLPNIMLGGRSQYQPCGMTLAGSVGQSEEFIGLREYHPGDPIRHLHWKSWARTGKPIVREFEDEYMPRYALALDTFAPFDRDNVFEEAVSIAASFACTLDTKESLLDLMFVGTEAYCFTSGRGVSQPERLLDILAGVELCRDKPFDELETLVRSHVRDLSACVYILIGWDEARQECVRRLRATGIELLVIVVCPTDSELPDETSAPGVNFIRSSRVAEGLAKL